MLIHMEQWTCQVPAKGHKTTRKTISEVGEVEREACRTINDNSHHLNE